jgi:hypothetical protein
MAGHINEPAMTPTQGTGRGHPRYFETLVGSLLFLDGRFLRCFNGQTMMLCHL